jgi:hypothetical protein
MSGRVRLPEFHKFHNRRCFVKPVLRADRFPRGLYQNSDLLTHGRIASFLCPDRLFLDTERLRAEFPVRRIIKCRLAQLRHFHNVIYYISSS